MYFSCLRAEDLELLKGGGGGGGGGVNKRQLIVCH